MGAHRPMTVPEKYYTFLDQAWPTNVQITADLDRCPAPDLVARRWQEFRSRRVLARSLPTEELTIVDGGAVDDGDNHFAHDEVPSAGWDAVLDEIAATRYPLGLPIRCRYLTSSGEDRARLVLIAHHAILDGRRGVAEIRAFVRHLDGQQVEEQAALPEPTAPVDHGWRHDQRQRVELLRSIGARARELGPPEPGWRTDTGGGRRSRMQTVEFDGDLSGDLVAAARARGTGTFSTLAAMWMSALVAEVCPSVPATVQLVTPVDVSAPAADPATPTSMAVGVLSQPYRVDPADLWGLAAQIRSGVRAAVDRGEADLFFDLTRVARVADLARGSALVAEALAAGPTCVALSNMGVFDPGSDPAWLANVNGRLSAAPNQVVFASVLSYRGRLVQTVSTDDERLPVDRRDALVGRYLDLAGTLATDRG